MKRPRMPRVHLPRNKVKPSAKVYRRTIEDYYQEICECGESMANHDDGECPKKFLEV